MSIRGDNASYGFYFLNTKRAKKAQLDVIVMWKMLEAYSIHITDLGEKNNTHFALVNPSFN